MKSAFDLQQPWFIPLWRRVVVTAVCLGWAMIEFLNGAPGWSLVFAAFGLWCAYQFFIVWDPPEDED